MRARLLNRRARWFDPGHPCQQFGVVRLAVRPGMHSPVAIRAERDHEPWIVGATVAHPADVMGLEIGTAVGSAERCRCRASFAATSGSGEHVVSHVPAAFEGSARRDRTRHPRACCSESAFPKLNDRHVPQRLLSECRLDAVESSQLEDVCSAQLALSVRRLALQNALANPFALVAKAPGSAQFSKEQKRFATLRVGRDREVSNSHLHIAELTFPEVFKDSIRAQCVAVPVLLALFARDHDHERMTLGRDDSALLLACIAGVNVFTSVVGAPSLEGPSLDHGLTVAARMGDDSSRRLSDRSPRRAA